MYDAWWPHLDVWGLADLGKARRGAVYYHATPASTLLEKAGFLRYEPLTADEESLHRPDLPFAVLRQPGVVWPMAESDLPVFAAAFGENTVLPAVPEAYLCAFGPNGGSKRPVRIRAEDTAGFTAAELMLKAAELQMPHLSTRRTVEGVGVYRSGLHRGRPCFYLWGAASLVETAA